MIPPALLWVHSFADLIGLATLEGLQEWDVRDEADPLRKVLHLRFVRPIPPALLPPLRSLLSGWADTNNCLYKRSEWKGRDFYALIMLKGLRPQSDVSPFDKEEHVWKQGRGSGGRIPKGFSDPDRGSG